jgi:hypothetical protein
LYARASKSFSFSSSNPYNGAAYFEHRQLQKDLTMKKQTLSKLFLACAAMSVAFACQPKKSAAPMAPPVAPPQAYDSASCTDPDECSEGAAIEPVKEAAPAAAVETAPAEEKSVATEPAASADVKESAKAESAVQTEAAPAEETASGAAPIEFQN